MVRRWCTPLALCMSNCTRTARVARVMPPLSPHRPGGLRGVCASVAPRPRASATSAPPLVQPQPTNLQALVKLRARACTSHPSAVPWAPAAQGAALTHPQALHPCRLHTRPPTALACKRTCVPTLMRQLAHQPLPRTCSSHRHPSSSRSALACCRMHAMLFWPQTCSLLLLTWLHTPSSTLSCMQTRDPA